MIKSIKKPIGAIYNKIALPAYRSQTKEACGILLGKVVEDIAIIEDVIEIANTSTTEGWFTMDAQEYYNALLKTKLLNSDAPHDFIGIFHSHPDFPGYPSSSDWKEATKGNVPVGVYLIYSFVSGYDTTKLDALYCYAWDGDHFRVLRVSNEKY